MTTDEADQVAAILSSADGGCSVCGEALAKAAAVSFPINGFNWVERVRYWRSEFWRPQSETSGEPK
jgi:hypothetical protein